RHAPHVPRGRGAGARALEGAAAGGVELSRRLAGVARRRGGPARAHVGGGAAGEDQRDLQAPEPEGPRTVPRPGRARVLATRGGAQPRDRAPGRPAGPPGVLRDGGAEEDGVRVSAGPTAPKRFTLRPVGFIRSTLK